MNTDSGKPEEGMDEAQATTGEDGEPKEAGADTDQSAFGGGKKRKWGKLKKTTTKRVRPAKSNRASPAAQLIDSRKKIRLAYAVGFAALIFAVVMQYMTVTATMRKQRVLVLDSKDTFYSSPLDYLRNDSPAFERVALLATDAILRRNPNGLAMPEIADFILLSTAHEKLRSEVQSVIEDYRVRQLRQIPEVEVIQALRSQGGNRIMRVSGKLIRTGNFQGMAIFEPWGFDMVIGIRPNPNLMEGDEYPFVVVDYKIRYRK